MRFLLSGSVILAIAAVSIGSAAAQPVALNEIPAKVAGAWIRPGGKCDAPALVVTKSGADQFLFNFREPTKRELHLKVGVPAPQAIGAPPAAAFSTTSSTDKVWIEVSMVNADTLRANLMGSDDPTTTYTRCIGARVG